MRLAHYSKRCWNVHRWIRSCLEEGPGKESGNYGNEEWKRIRRGAESQSIILSRSETNSTTIQRIRGTEMEKMIFELWSLILPEIVLVYFTLSIANLAKFIKLQKEILSVWSQLGNPSRCSLPLFRPIWVRWHPISVSLNLSQYCRIVRASKSNTSVISVHVYTSIPISELLPILHLSRNFPRSVLGKGPN